MNLGAGDPDAFGPSVTPRASALISLSRAALESSARADARTAARIPAANGRTAVCMRFDDVTQCRHGLDVLVLLGAAATL